VKNVLFSDTHLHVNPVRGLGAEKIAKKFKREGGWFIAIVALPPYYYGFEEISIESYMRVIELISREAARARELGLEVARFMGIHPAEIDEYYKRGVRGEKLYSFLNEVLKLVENAVRNGLLDGIGEVGRQHYTTSPERFVFSEVLMRNAMILAKDLGVPLQLHLEQGGFITVLSIKTLVDSLGINSKHVILHHTNTETSSWANNYKLPFTAPVKYFNEEYLKSGIEYCMLESDFLDDPRRPGVSAYPWEIPVVVRNLVAKGGINEEQAYRILVDNVVKYMNVESP
jgi:TatD-related deoxyribonuclease